MENILGTQCANVYFENYTDRFVRLTYVATLRIPDVLIECDNRLRSRRNYILTYSIAAFYR